MDYKSLTGMGAHPGVVPADVCIHGKQKHLHSIYFDAAINAPNIL